MVRIPSQAPLTSLRDFLLQSGYYFGQLRHELGLSTALHADFSNLAALLERTSGDARLPLLARLFFVGWPVAAELCRKYIPESLLQLCVEAEILTRADGEFAPAVVLFPFEDSLLMAADAPRVRKGSTNIVIGPSPSTSILARAALRSKTASVLDIGTGTGVLGILAARFCECVVGTDVNERAVAFAKFNSALNGVSHTEFLIGDALEPVAGRHFSRILANPPFFLTPARRFVHSDSPLQLDGFTRKLAIEVPEHLEEGGVFQMICEWVEVEDEPWQQRVQSWTAASGCDVLLLLGPSMTTADYAERRSQEAAALYAMQPGDDLSSRLSYLREHRVQRVISGVFTMRRRAGRNWFFSVPVDLNHTNGHAIEEQIEAITFLMEQSEDGWLRLRLRFAPDAIVDQAYVRREDGWQNIGVELRKPNGIGYPLKVDLPVLQTIELFDGHRTIAEVMEKTATIRGISLAEAKAQCLVLVKRLLQSSFVRPVEADESGSRDRLNNDALSQTRDH